VGGSEKRLSSNLAARRKLLFIKKYKFIKKVIIYYIF
jgi:hypothetical protein